MKKHLTLFLSLSLTTSLMLAGCTTSNNDTSGDLPPVALSFDEPEELDGVGNPNAEAEDDEFVLGFQREEEPMMSGGYGEVRNLTDEDLAVFEEAMADVDGVTYVPLTVSTQVVAGTNYRFLCNATGVYPGAEPTLKYVTIYQDLDGNLEVTDITDADDDNGNTVEPPMTGGYGEVRNVTDEDLAVFEEAMADMDGVAYVPLSVSTQVVAGTNYRFLCSATGVYPGAEPTLKFVTIYQDLDGNLEVTDIEDAE
ncbi:MAG: hypothetical protein FWG90_03040 [Oscillospiraceae bacterium]|nr:hypothetical protein [Oscillospiraceae bacterium]